MTTQQTDPEVMDVARHLWRDVPELTFADAVGAAEALVDMHEQERLDEVAPPPEADDAAYPAWLDQIYGEVEAQPDPSALPAKGIAHMACGIDPVTTWPEEGPQTSTEDFTPAKEGFR